jgi:hypothetical protein
MFGDIDHKVGLSARPWNAKAPKRFGAFVLSAIDFLS